MCGYSDFCSGLGKFIAFDFFDLLLYHTQISAGDTHRCCDTSKIRNAK